MESKSNDTGIIARLRIQHDGMLPKGEFAFITKSELGELLAAVDSLTKERDEARWRLCKIVGDQRGVWGEDIAKEYGWHEFMEGKP